VRKRFKGLKGLLGKGQIVGRLLLVIAALLIAYAASVPLILWKSGPETIVNTLDPEIIVELVALVVAVLALGSTASYLLLRQEVQSQVRREFEPPLKVANLLLNSRCFYLEYSKALVDARYLRSNLPSYPGNLRLREAVSAAVNYANRAYDLCRSLPELSQFQDLKLDATNDLAYHLATRYLLLKEDSDRKEAVRLADDLKSREDGPTYAETVAWVRIICPRPGTNDREKGQGIIEGLITGKEASSDWRALIHLKYTNLFELTLPYPSG